MIGQAIDAYEARYEAKWQDAPPHCQKMWLDAWGKAMEKAISVVETYRVSVGNSAAGEMAAEWTMENLREVRDELREMGYMGVIDRLARPLGPNAEITGG